MTVETRELVWLKEGFSRCRRSTAMRLSAVLSRTTTASAFSASRLSVSMLLYGCTTTSLAAVSFWLGNTLHVRQAHVSRLLTSAAYSIPRTDFNNAAHPLILCGILNVHTPASV